MSANNYVPVDEKNFTGFQKNNFQKLGQGFFGGRDASNVFQFDEFDNLKQKAQYDTSVAGAVNSVYGATLYFQDNQERNFLAALPQVDRTDLQGIQVGDTVPKAYRAYHSPVSLQTHSEGGSIQSGVTGSTEEFSVEVKRSDRVIEVSDLLEIESMIEDAVGMGEYMDLVQTELDLAIDRDALAAPALEADSGYSNVDEITPLDRVIASQDEEDNADDVNDNAFTDGALDYGTVDRSADSWADAYVDHNGVSGNRQLTRDLMDDFLSQLGDFGSSNPYQDSIILTGRNSAKVLSDLMADSSRGTRITFDSTGGTDEVEDAETMFGIPGTTRFRHYDGIPIVENQNAPTDGLERIFVLPMDTIRGEPKIAIESYAEPYVETAGRGQSQGYLALGEYKEEALFTLNHEVVVRDFGSCGKLRDLSE